MIKLRQKRNRAFNKIDGGKNGLFLFVMVLLLLVSRPTFAQVYDWEVVVENDDWNLRAIDFWSELSAIAVGDNGLVVRTDNGGRTWQDLSDPSFGDISFIEVVSLDTAYMTNGQQVYMTIDGGGKWQLIFTAKQRVNGIYGEMHWDDNIYLACDKGELWVSGSLGKKWYQRDTKGLVATDDDILMVVGGVITGEKDTVYALTTSNGGYQLTTNEFDTWKFTQEFFFWKGQKKVKAVHEHLDYTPQYLGTDHIFFSEENEVTCLNGDYPTIHCDYARKKINGGTLIPTWEGNNNTYGWLVGDEGYMMESKGSYRDFAEIDSITQRDLHWVDYGSNLHPEFDWWHAMEYITVLAVGDGVILRKTMGWKPLPTQVFKQPENVLKLNVYPNPSNGVGYVDLYGVDGKSGVLSVYDLRGVRLKTVFDGPFTEGMTLQIAGLTAGVYIVELVAEDRRATQKLVIR